jgi:hypothetical protein
LYGFAFDHDCFGGEIDTDGDLVLLLEGAVDVLMDQGGLADACVEGGVPESPMRIILKLTPFNFYSISIIIIYSD